ncbi:hypothetical protein Tco_0944878 [Tanacetum coccineum]
MTTTNQGMSIAEIEQIVVERVANAIKTIAIYETKTRMDRKSMSQIKQQEDKHTLPGQATRKAVLEIYHYVTSASFITLARVQQNVAIANGLVIKLEIVGPQSSKQNKGPHGKIES